MCTQKHNNNHQVVRLRGHFSKTDHADRVNVVLDFYMQRCKMVKTRGLLCT